MDCQPESDGFARLSVDLDTRRLRVEVLDRRATADWSPHDWLAADVRFLLVRQQADRSGVENRSGHDCAWFELDVGDA